MSEITNIVYAALRDAGYEVHVQEDAGIVYVYDPTTDKTFDFTIPQMRTET